MNITVLVNSGLLSRVCCTLLIMFCFKYSLDIFGFLFLMTFSLCWVDRGLLLLVFNCGLLFAFIPCDGVYRAVGAEVTGVCMDWWVWTRTPFLDERYEILSETTHFPCN